MAVERVGVEEAGRLLAEGYAYLDVRSEPEFAAGHAPHAYNIPVSLIGETGFEPNPRFLDVVRATFTPDQRLLVACQSGGRSQRAAAELIQAGYRNVVELRAGFDGCRDAFGRREPGWGRTGRPIELGSGADRSYASLLSAVPSRVTPG